MVRYAEVPFHPAHSEQMHLNAEGLHTAKYLNLDALGRLYAQFPSWTLFRDEQPLAAYGFLFPWPGRADIWARFDRKAKQCPVPVARTLWQRLEHTRNVHGLYRVETTVRLSSVASSRLMEWLMFTCDHLLDGYGPEGEDFLLYVRRWPRG